MPSNVMGSVLGTLVLGEVALGIEVIEIPSNRKLIDYLPLYMQEYLEMQKIMEAQQSKVDRLWLAAENALADQFILDATANGVSRWETLLDISPKDTDTLEERKFRLLTRLNQELPYTLRKLEQVLINLCGEDAFAINLRPNEYYIEIQLALGKHFYYQEVVELLNKMIPANMIQYVKLMYNPHNLFLPYRHMDLAPYTHHQIRNEVFDNA